MASRGLPVDRAAVVRVDQAQIPQLGALVGVGHARCRQLDQKLCQGVGSRRRSDPRDERGRGRSGTRRAFGVEQGPGEAQGGLLVGLVLVQPAAALLALAQGLDDVALAPLVEGLEAARRRSVGGPAARRRRAPGRACTRPWDADRRAGWPRSARASRGRPPPTPPAARRARPAGRGRPRRAWCRGWRWSAWSCGHRSSRSMFSAWSFSGVTPMRVRLAADLVERQQAREAVEGGVLQRLRHHRPGELLEAVEPALASLVGLLLEEGAQPGQSAVAAPPVSRSPAAPKARSSTARSVRLSGSRRR